MKEANIYTYTVVHTSTIDFQDRTPYACAIVEDKDGQRTSCILEGYALGMDICIGMPVRQTGHNEDGTPRFSL